MGQLIDMFEWKRKREEPTQTETIIDKIKKIKHSQERLEALISELKKRKSHQNPSDQDDSH